MGIEPTASALPLSYSPAMRLYFVLTFVELFTYAQVSTPLILGVYLVKSFARLIIKIPVCQDNKEEMLPMNWEALNPLSRKGNSCCINMEFLIERVCAR